MNEITRHYRICGVRYRIDCPAEWTCPNDDHISAFRTDPEPWDQHITFSVEEVLPEPAGVMAFKEPGQSFYLADGALVCYVGGQDPFLRLECRENRTLAAVRSSSIPNGITARVVMSAMMLPRRMIQHSSFILHSSYICHNGKAILFTAPSGTGKSTQADLWCRLRGAELLNGDRSGVMTTPEGVFVHGVPFNGSSGVSKNVTAPLAAIVYLSQAPTTTITRQTGLRAFRSIWEGCTVDLWDSALAAACTDLVLDVVRQVPVFHLACTPDESAVNAVEQAISNLR